jgi:hypothetical protein
MLSRAPPQDGGAEDADVAPGWHATTIGALGQDGKEEECGTGSGTAARP